MHSKASLAADLRRLGCAQGTTLLVHASLGSMGPVRDGARTVVRALRAVLGPEGTLVVPAFTAGNSRTSPQYIARTRGMTDSRLREFHDVMEPFRASSTPSEGMGRIAEEVRRTAGARRSGHPQTSFAALGAHAERVTAWHAEDCHLGEQSPLGRLYELGAHILLLGVGFDVCTAFHLAEYRPPGPTRRYDCKVLVDGTPRWTSSVDVDLHDEDFGPLGRWLETRSRDDGPTADGRIAHGRVGNAESRLLPLRWAVDSAVEWMDLHRPSRAHAARGPDVERPRVRP
ncbi:aminoglycoside N(3)-acetyltransferase [Streptomyces sp. NPDC048751]|uniref:aminoglycoside N(3)-acetyltransferase n=1 Tax=Streptomyces sp. NPDC048751 TaxID=3365591 RepID=UPI003724BCA7